MENLSSYHFKCKKCNSSLLKNGHLNFIFKEDGSARYRDISIKPDFGQNIGLVYGKPIQTGKSCTFFCSHCYTNLTSKVYKSYASILLCLNENISFEFLISTLLGEHKKFIVTEDFNNEIINHPLEIISQKKTLKFNPGSPSMERWPLQNEWY